MAQSNRYLQESDLRSLGALFALICTAAMAAVYAAVAFTLERRDTSADFVATLPPTRGRVVASKAIVAAGCVLAMGLPNLTIYALALARGRMYPEAVWVPAASPHVVPIAAAAMMLFGIAWLLSTFLTSTAVAASVSFAITAGWFLMLDWFSGWSQAAQVATWNRFAFAFGCSATLIGVASFVAGTLYYLRRVEP